MSGYVIFACPACGKVAIGNDYDDYMYKDTGDSQCYCKDKHGENLRLLPHPTLRVIDTDPGSEWVKKENR